MRQTHAYKIDLTKIEGDGEFSCPGCGVTISPDDEREEAYSILGSKANIEGLEEIIIQCNKCTSRIHLIGFSFLQYKSDKLEGTIRNSREASICYISHI